MESIILAIIVVGGSIVGVLSPSIIRKASHRPANGELKTLERIGSKVESIVHHPAMRHASMKIKHN